MYVNILTIGKKTWEKCNVYYVKTLVPDIDGDKYCLAESTKTNSWITIHQKTTKLHVRIF